MNDPVHVPAILEEHRRVRYLKLIALFKILKGLLLFVLGFSLLFLNSRPAWLDQISDWTDDQILLHHSRPVHFLLSKLQDVLAGGGVLHATGLLSLFYCAVLFTEGFGVYFQKRWAEWLMICATGALIPVEVRHLWHRPGLVALVILLANCFIVWFLYLVLKREKPERPVERKPELVETR
ncbi:MAG: hypothetical protein DME34_06410 [Verrucomicrobia bacterium]|nr:MAG: hypothetical protein DME34_06410 [Verrucomicrobiota bacterium]